LTTLIFNTAGTMCCDMAQGIGTFIAELSRVWGGTNTKAI
jgi:hypothetical protein